MRLSFLKIVVPIGLQMLNLNSISRLKVSTELLGRKSQAKASIAGYCAKSTESSDHGLKKNFIFFSNCRFLCDKKI